jgi:uncharacterized protein (DUF2147 family)
MKILSLIFLSALLSFSGFSQSADAIIGKWVNSTGEAHIEIFKTGNQYAGKIAWLKNPKDEKGSIKTDSQNPNLNLRSKPILGLRILNGFVFDEDKWTDGKIYDPKSGKTYSCNITLKSNGDLNLRGYIGVSLLGRTDVWKKLK